MLCAVAATPPFPYAGELAALAAALLWACSITIFRRFGKGTAPMSLNLFKCAVAVGLLGMAAAVLRPPWPQSAAVPALLVLSGVIGLAVGDTAFFAALSRLGAQPTSAGLSLAPAFVVLIAGAHLRETITWQEGAGITVIIVAVAGAILFSQNNGRVAQPLAARALWAGVCFVLLSALSQSIGMVIQRQAFAHADLLLGTLLRLGPAVCVLAAVQAVRPDRAGLRTILADRRTATALAIAAFLGTFMGVFLLSVSMKYSRGAGVAAALSSTFPLWVIPIARVFLKERTNWKCIACTVVAVSAVAMILTGGGPAPGEQTVDNIPPAAAAMRDPPAEKRSAAPRPRVRPSVWQEADQPFSRSAPRSSCGTSPRCADPARDA